MLHLWVFSLGNTHIYAWEYTHSNHDSRKDSPSFDLDKVLLKPT